MQSISNPLPMNPAPRQPSRQEMHASPLRAIGSGHAHGSGIGRGTPARAEMNMLRR